MKPEDDDALDRFLADAIPARAPERLTDSVLARLDDATPVAARPLAPRAAWPLFRDPMPLFVRVAMEPAVMLALVLSGLCLWQGPALARFGLALVAAVGSGLARDDAFGPPWVLALGFLPLAGIAAIGLYHASARWARRAGIPRRRPTLTGA